MMNKWGLTLMLIAMLGLPVLACGFPVPVSIPLEGMETAADEIVCAVDEDPATCETRATAFALMDALDSGAVENATVFLSFDVPDSSAGEIALDIDYEFVVNPESEILGADVAMTIVDASGDLGGGLSGLAGSELMIVNDMGYGRTVDQTAWSGEDVSADPNMVLGLAVMLGIGGNSVELYNTPESYTVTLGDAVEIDGQMMQVQVLRADVDGLLADAEGMTAALNMIEVLTGGEIDLEAQIGMPVEQFVTLAPMFALFITEFDATSTLYIGADDGLIHRVEDNYALELNIEGEVMGLAYTLEGDITRHDAIEPIVAPEDVSEDDGMFGGIDLGGVLGGN